MSLEARLVGGTQDLDRIPLKEEPTETRTREAGDADRSMEPSPERPSLPRSAHRAKHQVLDRHDQVIGVGIFPGHDPGDGSFRIEVTDAVRRRLGLQDGSRQLPRDWVAAVRRDEIRLSMGLHDPELLTSLVGE